MLHTTSNFENIYLGNNLPISLSTLLNAIDKAIGKKAIINKLPDQQSDVPDTCADISKEHELLKYYLNTTLEGLNHFLNWKLNEN